MPFSMSRIPFLLKNGLQSAFLHQKSEFYHHKTAFCNMICLKTAMKPQTGNYQGDITLVVTSTGNYQGDITLVVTSLGFHGRF